MAFKGENGRSFINKQVNRRGFLGLLAGTTAAGVIVAAKGVTDVSNVNAAIENQVSQEMPGYPKQYPRIGGCVESTSRGCVPLPAQANPEEAKRYFQRSQRVNELASSIDTSSSRRLALGGTVLSLVSLFTAAAATIKHMEVREDTIKSIEDYLRKAREEKNS